MMNPDIYCSYEDMPYRIKSFVRENPDMSYTIVLNNRLTQEILSKAYEHERSHILNEDHRKIDKTIQEIESEAHKLSR